MMRGKGVLWSKDMKGKPKEMWETGYWIKMHGKETEERKNTKGRRETIVRKHCLIFVFHYGVVSEWLVWRACGVYCDAHIASDHLQSILKW